MDGLWRTHCGGWTGYDTVRIGAGLLLLVAAGLKGHQLATEPVYGPGMLNSRWLLIGGVEFELLLGFLLLGGKWPSWTQYAAIASFSAFAGVSLLKALAGETSCGCFGKVSVNPWWTLALDTATVTAVLIFGPARATRCSPVRTMPVTRWWALSVTICVFLGLPGLLLVLASGDASTDLGVLYDGGRGVLLTPDRWLGKRLPLMDYIDSDAVLDQGRWFLVLYQSDCPACREAMPAYVTLAERLSAAEVGTQVALIEAPPYGEIGSSDAIQRSRCALGRLRAVKEWFAATPIELALVDGSVTGVKTRFTAAASESELNSEDPSVDRIGTR